MSNDIFVIANMALDPDSSSLACKTGHEPAAPIRITASRKRLHLQCESDQVIQAVVLAHGRRIDVVLRAMGTCIRIGNQAICITHRTQRG